MRWMIRIFSSSLGLKYLMAITGLLLFGFVFVHLIGNMLVFGEVGSLNSYAQKLQNIPLGGIWLFRFGLFVIFILHIAIGVKLTLDNMAARPVRYAVNETMKASLFSRSMIYSGAFILCFVVYHLCHYTFKIGVISTLDSEGRPDVFRMVVDGFSSNIHPWIYTVSLLVFFFHIIHGLSSLFQSLGMTNEKYRPMIEAISHVVGLLVTLGMIAIPIFIWFGFMIS